MGQTEIATRSKTVMPEALVFNESGVLMLHGSEGGKSFWWPPGAYWTSQKECDLSRETPEQWLERTIGEQVGLRVSSSELRGVDFIRPGHSPVLIYTVMADGEVKVNKSLGFGDAHYFDLDELPENIGRDTIHAQWLRSLLSELRRSLHVPTN